jgi:predicted transcriptional regulator
LLFTSSQPVNLSYSFFKSQDGTHSGEAVKTKLGTIELLAPLITSKTRLKLLTRFFLNQSVDGYLQGLSKELDENTNSIRLELNRLEKAGLLASKTKGRRKLYSVNTSHPLTSDLTSIVRKVTGIDALVERVTANLPCLEQVWVCGDLAKGLPSKYIEATLVGLDLDRSYIKKLTDKAQSLTGKTITVKVEEETELSGVIDGLLVWQKLGEQ